MTVIYLARHAETVLNANARMQGNAAHTPLTRAGIAQAEAMGAVLAEHFAGDPPPIWASPAGRVLQTVAIIAEHLGVRFFDVRTDERLREIEIGDWVGRDYADIQAELGTFVCPDRRLFTVPPPNGEWYPAIAERVAEWWAERTEERVLVVSHGITARVLRGHLAGGNDWHGVPVADDVPQGSIVRIEGERESVLHVGAGAHGVRQGY